MANEFELDPAVATKAAKDTGDVGQAMKGEMTKLAGQLEVLTNSAAYQGKQAVAFTNTHTQAQDYATRLHKDLDTMQEILTKVAQHTASVDEEVEQNYTRLAGQGAVGLV